MGYTLKDIINELMIECGETQNNKFARYYQFGVAALRSFNLDTSGVPKTVELSINDNDTADLPLDYLNYTRIALCCNGQLYCLGRNDSLCLNKQLDNCGNEIIHQTYIDSNYLLGIGEPTYPFRNGEFTGGLYGIGGDNNCLGYYRIDAQNNQIKLSQLTKTSTIILEYLADIESVDGDFEVHPFCIEALKDYVFWKHKFRSNKPLAEQGYAEQTYKKSARVMRHRFSSSTKEEWVAAFHAGNKATPKL